MVISAKRSTNAITTIQKNDVRACVHHRRKRPDKGLESRVREWIAVPMFICS